MSPKIRALVIFALTTSCISTAGAAEIFTIQDAIRQTINTNPGVYEAGANRRATESEMRQVQSTLLPQVRLEARVGPDKFDQAITPAPTGNNVWRDGQVYSVVVRQQLFDGFATINEIWRQAARVDAAAMRTFERTELLALDAAESYLDVVRYTRLNELAARNLTAHQTILRNVESRYSGGRAGEGDLQQTIERVAAAEAAAAGFRQSLEEARGKFRKVIGIEPYNLRWPGRLPALPTSKDESLQLAVRYNPTIRAAQADADAARFGYRSTAGAFVPSVSLEGRANTGTNYDSYIGRRDDISGKVVFSWDVFRGGQDAWKRNEMAERYIETTQRHARLQRDALESIDKAWAARTISGQRIAALNRQVAADRRTIDAYTKEYDLGQRSLIDLLNAQNQVFNASVSLVSVQSLSIFADYQLLATMGHLLNYLKESHSIDALPLSMSFAFVPLQLAPVRFLDPDVGSAPLTVTAATVTTSPKIEPTPVSPASRFGRESDAPFQAPYVWSWPYRTVAQASARTANAQMLNNVAEAPEAAQAPSSQMSFAAPVDPLIWLPDALRNKR